MSGLWPLPTVQSFVPSISLPPGEPHIAPLYHYSCTTACYRRPNPILNTFSSKVVQGKGFLQTHIENRPKVPFVAKH